MRSLALRQLFRARATPLIVATALLMENIDSTVLATALPRIATDLGANPIHLKLALTSYLLAVAIFIPASGWVADKYGARRVFRWAIVVFAVGSIACGASTSLGGLIAARVLQGIGGSMMVPVGRLIVLRVTPRAGLVGALAWLTVPALIGPVIGPPLGGFITTFFDWRWIFWINIPIALAGIGLVTAFIPRAPASEVIPGFDLKGFLLIGPGLAAFLTGLTMAGLGLAPARLVAGMSVGGLILIGLYVQHALRVADPLVDLRLLRLPTFAISALGGTFFRVGGGALPFLLPLLFQIGFGLSPLQSGMLTFASGFGAILMKFIAQPLLRRFGFRRVLMANAICSAAFILAPAGFTVTTPYGVILATLFFGGVCRSLQFTSINAMAYAEVPPERLSSATSFNAALQQLSGSVGITIAAFALQLVQACRGDDQILPATFPPVFMLVAVLAMLSIFSFARLRPESGGSLLASRAAE